MFKTISRKRLIGAVLALAALAALLYAPFLVRRVRTVFSPQGETRALPVLMYHSLLRDKTRHGPYVVAPETLEADIKALCARGYSFVSVDEVLAFVNGDGTLPEKPVLLTLDDGYLNNLTYLPDILVQQNVHAVIAVVGEYTDIFSLQDDHSPSYSHMTWADLSELAGNERIELANHSYYLHHQGVRNGAMRKKGESKGEWLAVLRDDTCRLQDALRTRCGVTPRIYVYPYGQIEDGADDEFRELGFAATFSCYERVTLLRKGDPSCLYSVGRFNRAAGESTDQFLARMIAAAEKAK